MTSWLAQQRQNTKWPKQNGNMEKGRAVGKFLPSFDLVSFSPTARLRMARRGGEKSKIMYRRDINKYKVGSRQCVTWHQHRRYFMTNVGLT